MYSVKPGRGPSLMGGVAALAAGVIGVFWTITASSMGAPGFFTLFGVVFVVLAVGGAIYNFANASARNRMSVMDITTGREEPDPIAQALGHAPRDASAERPAPPTDPSRAPRRVEGDFCPYCGARVQDDFDFCPKCGKDI